jgi:hypothetical protein
MAVFNATVSRHFVRISVFARAEHAFASLAASAAWNAPASDTWASACVHDAFFEASCTFEQSDISDFFTASET